MITEAIILAGGTGTRLRSEVSNVPKPMAPVLNKPFLEILIRTFYRKGIKHFILSLGYMSDFIIEHFQNRYDDIKISFAVEKEKLDTGGAIRLATTLLQTENALVLNGDTLFDIDLSTADRIIKKYQSPIIFGRIVDNVSRYGQLLHVDGLLIEYSEKNNSGAGCINAGVYIIPKNLLDNFELNMPFSMEKDFFSSLTAKDGFHVIISNGYFIDIGIAEDYQRAQREMHPYAE